MGGSTTTLATDKKKGGRDSEREREREREREKRVNHRARIQECAAQGSERGNTRRDTRPSCSPLYGGSGHLRHCVRRSFNQDRLLRRSRMFASEAESSPCTCSAQAAAFLRRTVPAHRARQGAEGVEGSWGGLGRDVGKRDNAYSRHSAEGVGGVGEHERGKGR